VKIKNVVRRQKQNELKFKRVKRYASTSRTNARTFYANTWGGKFPKKKKIPALENRKGNRRAVRLAGVGAVATIPQKKSSIQPQNTASEGGGAVIAAHWHQALGTD